MEDSAENCAAYGGPAPQLLDGNITSGARDHSCNVLAKTVAVFETCLGPNMAVSNCSRQVYSEEGKWDRNTDAV